jgi:hypothetical protein
MQNDLSHPIIRRQRGRTLAGMATLAAWAGLTLWAQTSTGPITLQSLSQRIDLLEKRIARDEASTSGGPAKAGGYPAGNDVDAAVQKLTAQVAELQQEAAQARSTPSTVKAPFRIVGAEGQTLLTVTESAPGSGKLVMKGVNGKAFTVGIAEHGDPYARLDASDGSAYIGSPAGKNFGVRLFAPGTENTVAAMTGTMGEALIALGLHGTAKVVMSVDSKGARVGILDNAGQKYVSNLTTHGNGGGDLELANPSGQVVAYMDANPTNNEGRAGFTSAGGEPLAKIGAAGEHGDVLLSGSNKTVAVWEMALTGMLR